MKVVQSIKYFFAKIARKIYDLFLLNNTIINDMALLNVRRIFYLALVAMLVDIYAIFTFSRSLSSSSGIEFIWRKQIIFCHSTLLIIMAALGVISFAMRKRKKVTHIIIMIQYAVFAVILVFGTALVYMDQAVTTNITPILIACCITGGVLLIRPYAALIAYGLTAFVFYNALGMTQMNQAVLLSNRINGIACIGVGFCLSLILWEANASRILQKRFILKQKRELQQKNRELEKLAFHDSMTCLYSRRKLEELLEREISHLHRGGHESCIVLLDIDNFKQINDNHGHPAGDMVIKRVASILLENVRETDYVARWGGDEFLILLPYASVSRGKMAAEKLRSIIEKEILLFNGVEIQLTSSFGITNISGGINDSLKRAYSNADKALYRAKKKGRNCIEVVS